MTRAVLRMSGFVSGLVPAAAALLVGLARAAEPAVELREADLAAVTFVNAAELEKTAEGVIPLRFTRASLDALGKRWLVHGDSITQGPTSRSRR